MTVVLQHQFFNLQVTEERFQVELSFDNIPERLIVPFASVKGFLDPAVQFGLQFEVVMAESAEAAAEQKAKKSTELKLEDKSTEKPSETAADDSAEDTPKVVSLDAFRKK
jgi:uncharacterized protein